MLQGGEAHWVALSVTCPPRRHAAERMARMTASRWRICRKRHQDGSLFAIPGADAPTDTYGLPSGYPWRLGHASTQVARREWKKGTHVLRRVRGGRPGLRRPLRELLSETASDRRAGRVHRRPALSVLRVVPSPVRLDEGGSRPGDPATAPRGDAAPRSL